jgi:hypothetical protein
MKSDTKKDLWGCLIVIIIFLGIGMIIGGIEMIAKMIF